MEGEKGSEAKEQDPCFQKAKALVGDIQEALDLALAKRAEIGKLKTVDINRQEATWVRTLPGGEKVYKKPGELKQRLEELSNNLKRIRRVYLKPALEAQSIANLSEKQKSDVFAQEAFIEKHKNEIYDIIEFVNTAS